MPRCKGKLDNNTLCPVKNAKFGLPGGKAEYCKKCSKKGNKGMVDVKNKKCMDCIQDFKNKIKNCKFHNAILQKNLLELTNRF
jgi:hypothetical protein